MLLTAIYVRVSSTLDKSTPRKSLVDRDSGTCWTSTQGLPQWVQLGFAAETPVQPKQLVLTFQGGFAATRVAVYTARDLSRDPEWTLRKYVYPEDVNRKQQFDLAQGEAETDQAIAQIKLVFEQSSDFFGRITIYDLDIHGVPTPSG